MEAEITRLQARITALEAAPAPQPQARARPTLKLQNFSNGPDEDWAAYKFHYEKVGLFNAWDDNQAKLALATAMKGRAATSVMDITLDGKDSRQLVAAYDARFLPAASSQPARVQFDQAQQKLNENILDYHGRMRQLWNRAYPAAQDEVPLIRRFSLGLRKKTVREQVMRVNPATFAAALEAAQNEASVIQVAQYTELGAAAMQATNSPTTTNTNDSGVEPMEIGALGRPSGTRGNSRCYFCDQPGHFKSNCRLLNKAKRLLQPLRRDGQLTTPARGGRGDGRQRMIAALCELLEEEEEGIATAETNMEEVDTAAAGAAAASPVDEDGDEDF